MPGVDGLAATARIRAMEDPPQVLVLTTFSADEYVFGALQAGAIGFLLKDTPPRELAEAVRLVADGRAMLIDFGAMVASGTIQRAVGTPPFVAPSSGSAWWPSSPTQPCGSRRLPPGRPPSVAS